MIGELGVCALCPSSPRQQNSESVRSQRNLVQDQVVNVLLKRLKAALGIGAIWGAAFAGVGAALGALLPTTSFLSTAVGLGTVAGVGGLLLGIGFAGLLSAVEGRRTLGELTSRRASLWGFLAGSALALVGSVAIGRLMEVVGAAESVLGLGIPVALQIAAMVTGAVSYGAVAAGLASATVSLAKRTPLSLPSPPSGSTRVLGGDAPETIRPPAPGSAT